MNGLLLSEFKAGKDSRPHGMVYRGKSLVSSSLIQGKREGCSSRRCPRAGRRMEASHTRLEEVKAANEELYLPRLGHLLPEMAYKRELLICRL